MGLGVLIILCIILTASLYHMPYDYPSAGWGTVLITATYHIVTIDSPVDLLSIADTIMSIGTAVSPVSVAHTWNW